MRNSQNIDQRLNIVAEKKDIASEVSSLRKRAEEIDRKNTSRIPENMKNLSPEEMKQRLRELRVHQIELEMQNEELRTAQANLPRILVVDDNEAIRKLLLAGLRRKYYVEAVKSS